MTGFRGRHPSAVIYALVFLVLSQVALAAAAPLSLAYDYRMDYNVIKDNPADVGATLDLIAKDVRARHLDDYVILLGDSITYSGPGGPSQSVSRYMDDSAFSNGLPPVYNVAIPAAQMGDFYTLLLMLDERGVSTDHAVLNLTYAGFVKRDPDPPIVYWLERDLQRLGPAAYQVAASDLAASSENKNRPGELDAFLEYQVYSKVPVLKYRDFIRAAAEYGLGTASQVIADSRPWYEKETLREDLKAPVYLQQFDPAPFVLDNSNLNVAFLRLIAQHQHGKDLVVYMSPLNKELMREEVSVPGFIQNADRLDDFLEDEAANYGFQYVDLTGAIPYELFSDHLHLVADGYEMLADILWSQVRLAKWF